MSIEFDRRKLFHIRRDGLTFIQCATAAIEMPEFVQAVDRLMGTYLTGKGTPLDLMIDKATNRMDHDLATFLQFVWDFVYTRVPMGAESPQSFPAGSGPSGKAQP